MSRRELFPRDRALLVQMVLVTILTPVVVVGLLAGAIALVPFDVLAGIVFVVIVGAVVSVRQRRGAVSPRVVTESEAPDLFALVTRLCVVANLQPPQIVIDQEKQPNSWVVDLPGRPARLHVTAGLLSLLSGDELAAVIAHELSHLANRDAVVMTVVGMPGALLITGACNTRWGGFWPCQLGALIAWLIGTISQVGTSALSRCRELSADQGACAITGRPSALASALLKVSGALEQMPGADLRDVAVRDAFHLVAVGARSEGWGQGRVVRRLSATHPTLQRRLRALEAMEHSVHHARLAPP